MLVHAAHGLVLAVWIASAAFASVDASLEEAARNMGASPWTCFRTVTLPLAAPGLMASAIFVFLESLDEFTGTYFVGVPDVTTLPLLMFNASMGGNYQIASITALLLLVPSIGFMLVVERFLKADVLAGVGKGATLKPPPGHRGGEARARDHRVHLRCALRQRSSMPRMAQPLDYHDFADHRVLFGIPQLRRRRFQRPFLWLAGLSGLAIVFARPAAFELPQERWPYVVFFLGLALTSCGSSYYHLAPDNARLFWDGLPITMTFAGLVSGQIVDRISVRAGQSRLVPCMVVGAACRAFIGEATERAGVGNVIPYALLQGYTAIVTFSCSSRSCGARAIPGVATSTCSFAYVV